MTPSIGQSESCILCGTRNSEVMIPASVLFPDQAEAIKCRKCGLVFLHSFDKEESIAYEEAAYWKNEDQNEIYRERKITELFRDEFENRLSVLERYTGGRGMILDVGCGIGHFLAVARQRGWNVRGLDISREAQREARQAHGLQVDIGTLEHWNFPRGSFDAVTLWDVIEHIRRPVENLNAANRLLRMGGILVMKTPNEKGFFKQCALAWYRIFGKRGGFLLKYVYYLPHYFSYSKQTMDLLLNRTGFEPLHYEIEETPQEFAREKIRTHYDRDPKHLSVIRLLPAAAFLARIFGRGNKLVVYARKVSEASR